MIRKGKLKVQLFLEGDTESYYFKGMKKGDQVEIQYEEVTMDGGGYTNFLNQVRKKGDAGYIAKFIVIDYDRALKVPGEYECFLKLKKYCDTKNKSGVIPYFLIVDNPDFEYFCCLHAPEYKNSSTEKFICQNFHYKALSAFKKEENVYQLLNSNGNHKDRALESIRNKPKVLKNQYRFKKKGLDMSIRISKTEFDPLNQTQRGTNIEEFFDIIQP